MPGPVTCTTLHYRAGVEVLGQDTRTGGGARIEYQILILDLILDTRDLSGPKMHTSGLHENTQEPEVFKAVCMNNSMGISFSGEDIGAEYVVHIGQIAELLKNMRRDK